jgi:hypothetical protein
MVVAFIFIIFFAGEVFATDKIGKLDCTQEGQIARFVGGEWVCSGEIADIIGRLDDLEYQIDELEQGSSGISGYEIVENSIYHNTSNDGRYGFVEVSAPAGKKIIGGGAFSFNPGIVIVSSYPISETKWRVDINAVGSGFPAGLIKAYAICANVEP